MDHCLQIGTDKETFASIGNDWSKIHIFRKGRRVFEPPRFIFFIRMLSPRTSIDLWTITFKLVLNKKLLHTLKMTGENTHITQRPEGFFEPQTLHFFI